MDMFCGNVVLFTSFIIGGTIARSLQSYLMRFRTPPTPSASEKTKTMVHYVNPFAMNLPEMPNEKKFYRLGPHAPPKIDETWQKRIPVSVLKTDLKQSPTTKMPPKGKLILPYYYTFPTYYLNSSNFPMNNPMTWTKPSVMPYRILNLPILQQQQQQQQLVGKTPYLPEQLSSFCTYQYQLPYSYRTIVNNQLNQQQPQQQILNNYPLLYNNYNTFRLKSPFDNNFRMTSRRELLPSPINHLNEPSVKFYTSEQDWLKYKEQLNDNIKETTTEKVQPKKIDNYSIKPITINFLKTNISSENDTTKTFFKIKLTEKPLNLLNFPSPLPSQQILPNSDRFLTNFSHYYVNKPNPLQFSGITNNVAPLNYLHLLKMDNPYLKTMPLFIPNPYVLPPQPAPAQPTFPLQYLPTINHIDKSMLPNPLYYPFNNLPQPSNTLSSPFIVYHQAPQLLFQPPPTPLPQTILFPQSIGGIRKKKDMYKKFIDDNDEQEDLSSFNVPQNIYNPSIGTILSENINVKRQNELSVVSQLSALKAKEHIAEMNRRTLYQKAKAADEDYVKKLNKELNLITEWKLANLSVEEAFKKLMRNKYELSEQELEMHRVKEAEDRLYGELLESQAELAIADMQVIPNLNSEMALRQFLTGMNYDRPLGVELPLD